MLEFCVEQPSQCKTYLRFFFYIFTMRNPVRFFLGTFRISNTAFFTVMCISLVMVYKSYEMKSYMEQGHNQIHVISLHNFIVDQFYENHKYWKLSKLGNMLYKNEEYPEIRKEIKDKTFTILVWKYWDWLKQRHVKQYGREELDPLSECSVKNCIFTGDNSTLYTADAVVVHLQHGKIPSTENRNPKQRWIFLTDEAPGHTFTLAKKKLPLSDLNNIFNWSMTYRSDADIPVPYGRTVGLKLPKILSIDPPIADLIPFWNQKRRDVLISILISNCAIPYRKKTIEGLQDHINVDVRGGCGKKELKKTCPGHFRSDCDEMSAYLFYLALENSKCKEYMTEKLFHNAYYRGAIPIIQGPSVEECNEFLPPNSYLHLDNYSSLKELANHVHTISQDVDKLLYYHQWRNHFEIRNEHGFFKTKSFHLCRVCEALNYNDNTPSVYDEVGINKFLKPSLSCRK